MNERYSRTELSQIINVDRHTLAKWEKSGKLVPFKDKDGKKYYTPEKIEEFKHLFSDSKVTNDDGYVDLCNVPRDVRGGFAWKKAAAEKSVIPYAYKGTEGELTIIEYENRKLKVKINGIEKIIGATDLGKARIGKLTGIVSYEYKHYVGKNIKDGETDITILELTRSKNGKAKAYRYRCNKCGQENFIIEGNISNKGCCPVCRGLTVVEGINDIATTDSWMISFFQNPEDAKRYYHGNSTVKIHFKCPDCGRVKRNTMTIDTLYNTKSIGCVCKDGFSYPNKLMYSICEQLKEKGEIADFESEFNEEWLERRRFDFLLIPNGSEQKSIIVEMDGKLGHGHDTRDKNISAKATKRIDEWKDNLARLKGYTVIRIDAKKSEVSYIRDNIYKSKLSDVFDLRIIDWDLADKFACSNYVKQVCLYYENNKPLTTQELGEVFNISDTTALRYIKRGEKYGWCKYDWDLYYKRRHSYHQKEHEEFIKRMKDVCSYYEYNRPVLAVDIARIFDYNVSTVLRYLEEGEKYGFPPYDKEYAKAKNKEQIKSIKREPKKRPVLCFSLKKEFIKRYESGAAAAKEFRVSDQAIHNCCRNKKTSCNMIFRYEDDCEIEY